MHATLAATLAAGWVPTNCHSNINPAIQHAHALKANARHTTFPQHVQATNADGKGVLRSLILA
jgi:hypothetical protein